MKIHIMHILYSFGVGGLENVIANLINNMNRDKFCHSICIFCEESELVKKIKVLGVQTFVVKRKFVNDPIVIPKLISLLKKEKPDIVRTYNWGGIEGILAAKLSGIKAVIHSEHGFDIAEISRQKKRRILARRFLLGLCNKIIVVSNFLQKWLIDTVRIEKEKIIYIPNGCDTEKFKPGKDFQKRKELGIEDNEILIGAVGALKEIKDYITLVKAFQKVSFLHNNLKLMFVGEGPQKKELEFLTEELSIHNKVIFAGRVTDTSAFYKTMDIFVLTSISENAPNALLEAMATGLPIIATDVGDVRYMLDGENGGIIIKPKDIDALVTGIEYFLNNQSIAKGKGNFARKKAEEYFNLEKMVSTYESLYLQILN